MEVIVRERSNKHVYTTEKQREREEEEKKIFPPLVLDEIPLFALRNIFLIISFLIALH